MHIRDLAVCLAAGETIQTQNRIVYSIVDSTNSVGRRMASIYRSHGEVPPPTVVVALEQTRGRGRLGNQWLSPSGGIYVSLVLPEVGAETLVTLPLRVVTALCREIDARIEQSCRVRWPNDLVVGGRKIGGVLIETVGQGDSFTAIVGFGINYSCDLPELMGSATTILQEARSASGFGEIVGQLISALESGMRQDVSLTQAVREYAKWSLHEIGQEMVCRTVQGVVRGRFLGFDSRGFLRLGTVSGERKISSGAIIENEETHES